MIPFLNIQNHRQRVRTTVVTLCIVISSLQNAVAQDTLKTISVKQNDTAVVKVHKNKMLKSLKKSSATDTYVINSETTNNVLTDTTVVLAQPEHSPQKALWYSVVLPGLGQVYNKQAWKIPIIYVGAGVVTYFAITNYNGREKFKNEYLNRVNGNTDVLLERYASYPDANIYSLYQSYNRNFQLSLIVGGFVYILNIMDAYVYGHLFDFEINEDVSLHLRPNVDFFSYGSGKLSPATGFTLQLKF